MHLLFFAKQLKALCFIALGLIITVGFNSLGLLAATTDTTNLTQVINAGALTVEFVDASYVTVASPSVSMQTKTFSFNSQTATGTLGSNTERLYWENPDAADGGYTIALSATGGTTSCWDFASGGSCGVGDYDFNDPGSDTDGADADTYAGQLSVDPSTGTITSRTGGTTGMTLGSSSAFSETGSVVSSITLVTAAAGAPDVSSTYVTGLSLSQVIPAEQASGTYTVNMTVTIA